MDKEINKIIQFSKLIYNPTTTNPNIINYIIKNNIDVNINIRLFNINNNTLNDTGIDLPLIYICCMNDNNEDLLKFLLKNNVKTNIDLSEYNIKELLYYSCKKYIPILCKYGVTLKKEHISEECEKYILHGNIDMIMNLLKHNAIEKKDIKPIIENITIPFKMLDILFNKIKDFSSLNQNMFYERYNYYIECYKLSFNLFLSNNYDINNVIIYEDENKNVIQKTFIENVLNTYFYELIEFILKHCDDNTLNQLELNHYSKFDCYIRNEFNNYIYNDENYIKIKDLIKTFKPSYSKLKIKRKLRK